METRHETWDSFWGKALRIDFFEGQWDTYRKVADARAAWLEAAFNLEQRRPVLSCACGEGGIELALARRGYKVTAIDRCTPLIHHAREQADKEALNITFLVADLLDDAQLPPGNGLVLCFDTAGLLSVEDEKKLMRKMSYAVAPGGVLLVDSPLRESLSPSRQWWPVGDGYLLFESKWDPKQSVQRIAPLVIEANGDRVLLEDPYDPKQDPPTGVNRYIYPRTELEQLVRSTGLQARSVPHQRPGYYMVEAREQFREDGEGEETTAQASRFKSI